MNMLISYIYKLMKKFHIGIKYGEYMHIQTSLDFTFNLELTTRNDIFQKKILLYNKRAMGSNPVAVT